MRILLVTYNVLFGYDKRVFDSLKAIRDQSNKYTHAIIALQEVRNKTIKDKLPETIQKLFPGFYTAQLVSPKPSLNDLGLMTLSRMPVMDTTPVLLPKLAKRLLNLQSLFLKSIPQYAALVTRFAVGRKILRVTNLHLNVLGGIPHKKKQMARILEYFQIASADYDIVCGDFNTIGPLRIQGKSVQRQKNVILKQLGRDFNEVPIPSWTCDISDTTSPLLPASKFIYKTFKKTRIQFRQKLDWVFVRGFKSAKASVRHDLAGSDHYPIFAILQTT